MAGAAPKPDGRSGVDTFLFYTVDFDNGDADVITDFQCGCDGGISTWLKFAGGDRSQLTLAQVDVEL